MSAARARAAVALAGLVALGPAGPARAAPADYPTEAVADYVFGCMATNGQTPDALRRCACSLDAIAATVPYPAYVQAETVLRMQQIPGGDDRAIMFRAMPQNQVAVDRLRQAQLEAEQKCF